MRRRQTRYKEMDQLLEQYSKQISQVRSLSTLQDLALDAERLLLSETYEWWILAKENVAA
jgi:hypothetical protein